MSKCVTCGHDKRKHLVTDGCVQLARNGWLYCSCWEFVPDVHTISDCLMALELAKLIDSSCQGICTNTESVFRQCHVSSWLQIKAMRRLAELAERER